MSYRGFVAPLPIGQLGFTGTQNPSQAKPDHFVFVDGAELDGGIIRKEGGASKINSSALDSGAVITSGITWSPTPGTNQMIVFTSGGSVLADSGAGTFSTTLASSLVASRDPPPYFLPCGGEGVGEDRKILLFGAGNAVKVLDDPWTSFVDISNPAADWSDGSPTFGVLHSFRVWAGGGAGDPHRLYYSTTSDHTDFTSDGSGTIPIYPGEGEGLVGGISVRGALILWKYPAGIYIVDTTDPTPANWSVKPLTRAVGTLSQHTIVQVENDVIYLDRIGNPHSLSATNEFGDINTSNIGIFSDLPPFLRQNLNLGRLRRAGSLWYQSKRQAWFSLPLVGSDEPNFRLILGFQTPTPEGIPTPRFFMSRRDVCPSIWLTPDSDGVPRPAFGDASGFVWLADQAARNKDSEGYPILFETASTDLSFLAPELATKSKSGQFLELAFEPRGDWDLTIEVYWDDILTSIRQFNMGSGGAALGSFTLDQDVLSSTSVKASRRRITGSGRRIKLVGSNEGMDQDVSISSFQLSFTVMDERE